MFHINWNICDSKSGAYFVYIYIYKYIYIYHKRDLIQIDRISFCQLLKLTGGGGGDISNTRHSVSI